MIRNMGCILVMSLLCACQGPEFIIKEASYENRPHLVVETGMLTYWYDMDGGGFSRILDGEGRDWVGYKTEPWGKYPASAASSFRGLPNLVFQGQDDGAGHPGHNKCRSRVEDGKIITESLSGLWEWHWTFREDHALLEVARTDTSRQYWFLYEGTPGGSFDPENSWAGTDQGGPLPAVQDYFTGDIQWGKFQWMYAGHSRAGGTFYMLQKEKDELMDMVSFLGNSEQGLKSPDGMTVFGFGRENGAKSLITGSQSFVIGLYPEKIDTEEKHLEFSEYLNTKFLK